MSNWVLFANLVVNGIVEGCVIGLGALALNLVFAVARFPNAATGDFMTTGAYAGYGMQRAEIGGFLAQGLAAIVASTLLAYISYLAVFRKLAGRPMVAALLASIGVGFIARSLIGMFVGHDPLFFHVPIVPAMNFGGVRVQTLDIWLVLISAATVAGTFLVLKKTSVGRKLRAIADNPVLAKAAGIRAEEVMRVLWGLVGIVTGIAGYIFALKTTVNPELGWVMLVPVFAAAIFGGIGSPGGAVLAGIVLGVLQELSTPFLGFSYKVALSFCVLSAMLLIRPQGLFGEKELVR